MKKVILYGLIIITTGAAVLMAVVWNTALKPNVVESYSGRIIIPRGATFNDLVDIFHRNELLNNQKSFILTARLKKLDRSVRPGSYLIETGMSNNHIVNMLRSGRQTPVKVTFNNIRTINELAGRIAGQLEADSSSIIAFLSDESNYSKDGFTKATVISVFIPDTYQFYWTTDAQGFYDRMLKEYTAFWNDDRVAAATAHKLSPVDVSIIASIVDDEVVRADEKPRIAGVYLNRLRLGIPLQACPTIKFALNDFTIRRVLYEHLTVDSPYNTYIHRGLPPGPVRCPSKAGIEAVLKAEKHDFLYFAARADSSGGHHFSRTLAEHNRYANEYHRQLNSRKIYE